MKTITYYILCYLKQFDELDKFVIVHNFRGGGPFQRYPYTTSSNLFTSPSCINNNNPSNTSSIFQSPPPPRAFLLSTHKTLNLSRQARSYLTFSIKRLSTPNYAPRDETITPRANNSYPRFFILFEMKYRRGKST